jgi:nicotinate-nucleotide adenylyltransferase
MKVGLFFGSFNPLHIGHLAIANYFAEFSDLKRIWLVISPQSPFKKRKNLLAENHRYYMAQLALEDDSQISPTNIEFYLPKPSYTIDTLTYLSEKYPRHQFCLILGSDNLVHLHKWKNSEELIRQYPVYVYPRPSVNPYDYTNRYDMEVVEAPLIEISSSFIRNSIKQGKDIRYFLPPKVYQYIREMHFYEQ